MGPRDKWPVVEAQLLDSWIEEWRRGWHTGGGIGCLADLCAVALPKAVGAIALLFTIGPL